MQRNIRAAPGVGRGRQVVGVDFAGDLEHGEHDRRRHFGAAGEPFGIGPALQHGFGVFVALVGLFLDVVKLVKHQQRVFQAAGRLRGHAVFCVVQQLHHGTDVVATQHGAQELRSLFTRDQRALFGAVRNCCQIAGFDFGRSVNAGWHAMRDQVQQQRFLALRWIFQQFDDRAGLLGRQWQRRNSQRGALGNMVAVACNELGHHGFFSWIQKSNSRGWQAKCLIGAQMRVAGRVAQNPCQPRRERAACPKCWDADFSSCRRQM